MVVIVIAVVVIGIVVQIIKLIVVHILAVLVVVVACGVIAVGWRLIMEEVADRQSREELKRLHAEREAAAKQDLERRAKLLSEAYEEVHRTIDEWRR